MINKWNTNENTSKNPRIQVQKSNDNNHVTPLIDPTLGKIKIDL